MTFQIETAEPRRTWPVGERNLMDQFVAPDDIVPASALLGFAGSIAVGLTVWTLIIAAML